MAERLTRAGWEEFDRLCDRRLIGYRGEPPAAAWEIENAGLAYFVSGASWTLVLTDKGRASLKEDGR